MRYYISFYLLAAMLSIYSLGCAHTAEITRHVLTVVANAMTNPPPPVVEAPAPPPAPAPEPPPVVEVPPEPTPAPVEEPVIVEDILADASWGPKKEGRPSRARVVCELTITHLDGHKVKFKDNRPSSWPVKMMSRGTVAVNGVMYLVVREGSGYRASKFEWLKPGQRSKHTKNIHSGYSGLHPKKGDPVWFVIASTDGRERSSVSQELRWP